MSLNILIFSSKEDIRSVCIELKIKKLLMSIGAKRDVFFNKYDVSTVEGLSQAGIWEIGNIYPTIIIVDSNTEVARWRGELPRLTELLPHLVCNENERLIISQTVYQKHRI